MDDRDLEIELEKAMRLLVNRNPQFALSVVTGLFVSTCTYAVKLSNEDDKKEIKINGMGNRNITIHAIGDGL